MSAQMRPDGPPIGLHLAAILLRLPHPGLGGSGDLEDEGEGPVQG